MSEVLTKALPEKDTSEQSPEKPFGYRYVWLVLVICAIALGVAGWFGGALTFSGANFFFSLIEKQELHQPFGRYSTAPFQWPALLASSWTSDLAVLRGLFGLGYSLAPIGALLASWLVVRRRSPRLIIWPVVGISVVCFPGLLGLMLESPIVAEWAWPLILLTLLALDDLPTISAGVVVTVFVFFLSANSLALFLAVAVIAFLRAYREPASRTRLCGWGAFMVVAAPLEYFVRHSDFAAAPHKITAALLVKEFRDGYFPLPFAAYTLALIGCALLLYLRWSRNEPPPHLRFAPAALLGCSGIVLVVYAATSSAWWEASIAKDIILPLGVPFFALCVMDHLWAHRAVGPIPAGGREEYLIRAPAIFALAALLALGLSLWSVSWSGLMSAESGKLAAATTYCVPPSQVREVDNALDGRYTDELALDLETRTPAHVVLSGSGCRLLEQKGELVLFEFQLRARNGWFHFRSAGAGDHSKKHKHEK
jgi:hypothetical protein